MYGNNRLPPIDRMIASLYQSYLLLSLLEIGNILNGSTYPVFLLLNVAALCTFTQTPSTLIVTYCNMYGMLVLVNTIGCGL